MWRSSASRARSETATSSTTATPERARTMLLAHLSDIHVLDLAGVRFYRFFNKRVTGGLNLLLKRSKAHKPALLEEALDRIEGLGCDHVLVTGDLTNLALPSEFERARRILEAH